MSKIKEGDLILIVDSPIRSVTRSALVGKYLNMVGEVVSVSDKGYSAKFEDGRIHFFYLDEVLLASKSAKILFG